MVVEVYKDTGTRTHNPDFILANIQHRLIRQRSFIDFEGKEHVGIHMQAPEVISALENLIPISRLPDVFTKDAKEIIDNGWVALYGWDNESVDKRRHALSQVMKLSEVAISNLKEKHGNGIISDEELEKRAEPIEGARLAALVELYPEKYSELEKARKHTRR